MTRDPMSPVRFVPLARRHPRFAAFVRFVEPRLTGAAIGLGAALFVSMLIRSITA